MLKNNAVRLSAKLAVFGLCAWNAVDDYREGDYGKATLNTTVALFAAGAVHNKAKKYWSPNNPNPMD